MDFELPMNAERLIELFGGPLDGKKIPMGAVLGHELVMPLPVTLEVVGCEQGRLQLAVYTPITPQRYEFKEMR